MATIIQNTVKFKVVERTDDSIHEFASIKRYKGKELGLVLDRTPSTWYQDGDSDAVEAIATNETHALITVFGTKIIDVPEVPEEPTL